MFGKHIKRFREKAGFTQAQLVAQIQTHHEMFSALDEITLSRWENGHTKPSRKKQIALLIFFDALNDIRDLTVDDIKYAGKLSKILEKRYKNLFSKSEVPYALPSSKVTVTFYEKLPEEKLNFYANYLEEVNSIKLNLTNFNCMNENIEKVGLYEFHSSNNVLMGHLLFIIAKNNFIADSLSKIVQEKISLEEGSSLYIITTYSASKEIYIYRNLLILDSLMSVSELPKSIYIRAGNDSGASILDTLEAEIVGKGLKIDNGVKLYNHQYNWILYKVSTLDLLSAKEFYIDEESIEQEFIFNNATV
ncbi:helix-turn-helix domain-containing protein [Shewanella japonica]|uniref:helix-turn-helix domain-containing protein n=1 Tax=Shewanella japonica TaxID=93973 RepID=UPI0024945F5C|nr:helix-turn-helix transcriptional regulator [Shewanella japonica]